VSYHFYPSAAIGAKRMSEFALFLLEKGIDVKVLCGSTRKEDAHPDLVARISAVDKTEIWAPRPIVDQLLAVLRRKRAQRQSTPRQDQDTAAVEVLARPKHIPFWRRHYRSAVKFIDRNKLWSVLAAIVGSLRRIRGRYDVIISSGPPMSPHLAAMLVARAHRAIWIADFRDPWIGNYFMTAEGETRWRLRLERAAQNACTRNCSRIVCASPGIVGFFTQENPEYAEKCTIISNGFDWRLPPKSNDGRLQLLYAGSLYFKRDPFPFFQAVDKLIADKTVNREKIKIIFVGKCESFGGVSTSKWLERHNLQDVVQIKSPVTNESLKSLIAESDVLVNFAQDQPFQIPGKTFECIGASRFSLVLTEIDSATAQVVRKSGTGIVVPPGDPEHLLSALEELYDRFVRNGETFVPDEHRVADFSREIKNLALLEVVSAEFQRRQSDTTC